MIDKERWWRSIKKGGGVKGWTGKDVGGTDIGKGKGGRRAAG